jgi:hypothetical protein
MAVDISGYMVTDKFFGASYIDEEKSITSPYPALYLHGGFTDTDTRFSMYFPDRAVWAGRLLTGLGGASGGDEGSPTAALLMPGAALNGVSMAEVIGACYVQSNQGHLGADMLGLKGDETIMWYRADAEAARFGKHLCSKIYGAAPHHAFIYGGSGGGNRTLWGLEGAPDVWDGGVPFMFGGGSFSALLNAARLLRPVISEVIDAMAPGGSGDPFALLDLEQREALAQLYRMGFPRGAEHQLRFPMPEITWPAQSGMRSYSQRDPTYVKDFFASPGYAGSDPSSSIRRALVERDTRVAQILTIGALQAAAGGSAQAGGVGLDRLVAISAASGGEPDDVLAVMLPLEDPESYTLSKMTFKTGVAQGRSMYIMIAAGGVMIPGGLGAFIDLRLLRGVRVGDEVALSNRDFLAYCYRYRHERSHDDGIGSGQFELDGVPIYPRRAPLQTGLSWTGRFKGKMILHQHLLDRPCWPTQAIAYERKVDAALGRKKDGQFRLYWSENAQHVPPVMEGAFARTRAIDYSGLIEQSLKDVVDWVEKGVEPPASTKYEWTRDSRVKMPTKAVERHGLQPVIRCSLGGQPRGEVKVGEEVRIDVVAEAPPGTGRVIAVEVDLVGDNTWDHKHRVDGTSSLVAFSFTHSYDSPGTKFISARATSHRDGDVDAKVGRLINIGRCRVVVS